MAPCLPERCGGIVSVARGRYRDLGNEGTACAQQLSTAATTTTTAIVNESSGRAPAEVAHGSINPLSICAGLLDMQVQVLRQSADRRALLVVDVFSAKPHPLSCIIAAPSIVHMGALPAGSRD
jgi:hypothetical protein